MMGTTKFAFAVVAGLALSYGAAAAQTAPAAAPAPADDMDQVVCHLETPMGSHIPKRSCATKRQWKEAHDAAQETINQAQSSGLRSAEPGGGG